MKMKINKKADIEDVEKFVYEEPDGGKEVRAYVIFSVCELNLRAVTFMESLGVMGIVEKSLKLLSTIDHDEFKKGEKKNVEIEIMDPKIKKINSAKKEIKLIDDKECRYKIKGKIIGGFVDHADFGDGIESLGNIIVDCKVPVEVELERDTYDEEWDFYLPEPAYPGAVTEFKRLDYAPNGEYVPDEDIIAKYADLHVGEYIEAEGTMWVNILEDQSDEAYFTVCSSKKTCNEILENYRGELTKCKDSHEYELYITSPLTYREIIDIARRANAFCVHAYKKGKCIHDVSRGMEY